MMAWYREADRKTRRVFWTCGAGWAMDTADGLVFQYMIPVLIAAFGMTLTQASYIASANYIAAALGGWLGGWLSDRFGRARILQLTILWFSLFSFLSGFAQNYEQLFAARVLQGVGFGAEWAVGAVLLGDLHVEPGNTLAVQPDGKLVVAGSRRYGDDDPAHSFFTARRFNPDGRPDLTFGQGGEARVDVGSDYAYGVRAVRVLADGKIAVGD